MTAADLTITTNQATLASDSGLFVAIDSDRNAATGQGGIDFLFILNSSGYDFSMWNGSSFVDAPVTTVHVFFSAGVARFVINKSELGNTSAFNFAVLSVQLANGAAVATDAAPDNGVYSYTLVAPPPPPPPSPPPPPPPPTVGLGAVTIKAPGLHAGRLFSIRDHVTTTATAVRVSCVVKVSGRALRMTGAYVRTTHTASCSGKIPAGTAGKRIAGTLTVTISGDRDTRSFSFVIRA